MLGAAASRPRLAEPLSDFVRACGIPFFNTQMGKGAVTGRVQPLHGHGRAVRAGLRALGDRPGRSDHRDRPRHGREAAVPHGAGRADGDPCRLSPRPMSSRCTSRMPRSSAMSARASRCWPTGSRASCRTRRPSCTLREEILARIADRADEDRFPLTPQRIVARRAASDAGGRHRLPGQRHVQDLVRPQLPHPCRQHAAARQCARHDGRRAAVGDDGRDASSGPAGPRGLRRRRLHDELAGDGDRGAAQARTSSC